VAQSPLSGWFVRGDSWVESPPQTGTRSATELRHGAELARHALREPSYAARSSSGVHFPPRARLFIFTRR